MWTSALAAVAVRSLVAKAFSAVHQLPGSRRYLNVASDRRKTYSFQNNPCLDQKRSFASLSSQPDACKQSISPADSREEITDPLPVIIPTKGVPIHLYTDINEIEPQALSQLRVLAESPLPTEYVSAMPDVHWGKGVTIGSVFASEKYVCPNAVGVDIGCGMAAIPIDGLNKDALTNDDKNRIQQLLKERIPTGAESYYRPLPGTKAKLEKIAEEVEPTNLLKGMLGQESKAETQLGTLGGGNHFLEVVHEVDSGQVWVMLHSGSRNIGNRIAQHYDKVAKDMLKKQGVNTHALNGLNYMPIDSQEGQDYLRDMEFCQRYAFQNRAAMKKTMLDVIRETTGFDQSDMSKAVNIHHNYCACEDCNGRKVWVTRKGATSAKLGEMGIIPGSMGTGSYITRGRGNPLSWSSSSHGAGRVMSRTAAKKNILQRDFEKIMEGIVCDTNASVKDEAPQAYKDLTVVMKNQESLTDIVHHLLPLVNVKGFGKPRRKEALAADEKRRLLEDQRRTIVEKLERARSQNLSKKSSKKLESKLNKIDSMLASYR